MKVVNLRLDESIVDRLDEISSKLLISRSELIRQAITIYLSLIENIGFYFKPSLLAPKLDVYAERNAISVDLGNNVSLAVFSVAYGGIGRKEGDWLRVDVERVAEIMAYQIEVESLCRFSKPLAILLFSGNELEYALEFYRSFRKKVRERVVLTDSEDFAETVQSFFGAAVIGLRDMSVKNVPERGDKIFLYGKILSGGELVGGELPDTALFRKLAELVSEGRANSIFPVKGDGVREACLYAASVAGGKLNIADTEDRGCPATAVIVTAKQIPLEGGVEIGEIL
ncbi:ribbon-helix-helix domain-containing protein [Geoglobus acetivorans]|uniref:Ribbon-helix-helix protein CopG domain-containing protein n=1 Tax=Geoglobus acetivorans TaxID=565033 RepID=A0A0A7GBH8_GEOAI|nr:hypothetical protein GACE_0151 [Geoglobus acetivorans]